MIDYTRPYITISDASPSTPHWPTTCELHDGPAVPSPTGHCEHAELDEDGIPGICCYCNREGEWPSTEGAPQP